MDNIIQQNPITQEGQTSSEFAKKEPLIYPRTIKKVALGCVALLGVLIVIGSAGYAYSIIMNNRNQPEPEPEVPVLPPEEPIVTDIPKFAYIKNQKTIFVSDTEAKDRRNIVEIPITSPDEFVALAWKNQNELGHSRCDVQIKSCEIAVYNFENKSIAPVLTSNTLLTEFAWSPDQRYLGYIEAQGDRTNLRLKLGTIDTILKTFGYEADPSYSKSRVIFSSNSQYVIFSTIRKDITVGPDGRPTQEAARIYPAIYIYQVNGAQIDEITNASDPFLIDDQTIGYRRDGEVWYKEIGASDETAITALDGYNVHLSPSKTRLAYWKDDPTINSVVLVVFENDSQIHRNILRGVIMPEWISDDRVVGIKTDSCLGESCFLYEFKTASLVIVDINQGTVSSVDQGRTFSELVFFEEANSNAD